VAAAYRDALRTLTRVIEKVVDMMP